MENNVDLHGGVIGETGWITQHCIFLVLLLQKNDATLACSIARWHTEDNGVSSRNAGAKPNCVLDGNGGWEDWIEIAEF